MYVHSAKEVPASFSAKNSPDNGFPLQLEVHIGGGMRRPKQHRHLQGVGGLGLARPREVRELLRRKTVRVHMLILLAI